LTLQSKEGEMKSKSIDKCAKDLAEAISERNPFSIDEVKTMIVVRFKACLQEFVKEYVNENEKEYFSLLEQQSKNRIGSHSYIQLGYKLSAARHKKAVTNRIMNEIKSDDRFIQFKNFVTEKFGEDIVKEFYASYNNGKEIEAEK